MVSLVSIHPSRGQPFAPDAVAAIVRRYNFQKFPNTIDEFRGDTKTFSMGKWGDVQIDEFAAYNDGIIASATARTDVIADFLDDLYSFALKEFGLERVVVPKEARFFESSVVVQMDTAISEKLSFLKGLIRDLEAFMSQYGLGDFDFQPYALQAGVDMARYPGKRPSPFSLVRRVNIAFEENYWWSSAPLKTDDHLKVLENLESAMR